MKRALFYFHAVLLLLFCTTLQAQNAEGTSGRNLPAFSSIVPNLQLLKTGYPSTKEVSSDKLSYSKDLKTGTHKFIARTITTDHLRAQLGSAMAKEQPSDTNNTAYQWRDGFTKTVNKLIIYCDSLILKETLWAPEANIEIQARILVVKGNYKIKSSPLPWHKAFDFNLLLDNKTKGTDGIDAGDISVRCDRVYLTENNLVIEANGSKGESMLVPTISVDYPKDSSSIKIYKNHECEGSSYKGSSALYSPDFNMVALAILNEDRYSLIVTTVSDYCWAYKSYDPNIVFTSKNKWDSRINDNASMNRITYDKDIIPGKGGNGGSIKLFATTHVSGSFEAEGGDSGSYIGKAGADVDYGKPREVTKEIKFKPKKYCLGLVSSLSNPSGNISFNARSGGTECFEVPCIAAIRNLNKELFAPIPRGNKVIGSSELLAFLHHPEYLQKRLSDLEAQYFVYFKRNAGEKEALNKEMDELRSYLESINKDKSVPLEKQADYANLYQKAIELCSYRNRNVDEFNNIAGYRPLLSLKSTLSYTDMKVGDETNLERDIRLFVLSDMMANQENSAKVFLEEVPKMIERIKSVNEDLQKELGKQNLAYDAIAQKAIACGEQIDSVRKELIAVENIILEKAEKDKKNEAIWRTTLKGLALAASVFPYGQPALGQIVGNGLNAAADQIGNVEQGTGAFVGNVMDKMDFSSVMKAIASKRLKTPFPDKSTYQDYAELTGNDLYDADLKAYNEKLAKAQNTALENGNRALGIASSYLKYSTSEPELEARVAQMRGVSVDFANVSEKISVLNKKKAEIFGDLQDAIQRSMSIEANIMQNQATIFKLERQRNATEYNQDLEEAFRDINAAAAKRLKWIEYQLIKTYEYTKLTPYNQSQSAFDVLLQKYKSKKATLRPANLADVIGELKLAYDNLRAEMGSNIINDRSLDGYKEDDDYSRAIVLANDPQKSKITNALLEEFNKKGRVTIDLQSDFVNEIIRPNEEHVRIKGIQLLDNLKFEGTLGGKITITLEVLDEGIVRKGSDFYLFQTGNPNGVSSIWTWDVVNEGGKIKVSGSSLAKDTEDLINFLTDEKTRSDKNIDKVNSFTYPPAWSKCRLTIQNTGGGYVPDLSFIEFRMKCVRLVNATKTNDVVLDIKTDNAPFGTYYTVTEGNKAAQDSDVHPCNYYSVLKDGTVVNLKLTEPDSATRKFVKWKIFDISRKNGEDIFNKEIKGFKVNDNTRIVAIFEEHTLQSKAKPGAGQKITLYEAPSTKSEIIAVEADHSRIISIPDTHPVNGFIRVAYRGTQEAFIKQ